MTSNPYVESMDNDLKVAQLIETELDAAATDEELNKRW